MAVTGARVSEAPRRAIHVIAGERIVKRRRHDGQRLDGIPHVGAGQAVIAPAPLLLDAQDAAGDQLGEMVAGRLRGDAGAGSQLARRPRLPAREGEADNGAGPVGQKACHERDIGFHQ